MFSTYQVAQEIGKPLNLAIMPRYPPPTVRGDDRQNLIHGQGLCWIQGHSV